MSERASRPLHEVFLERVIHIAAVQRERTAVTDEDAAGFFVDGRLVGDPELPDYRWSLDEPELFSRRGVQVIGVLTQSGFTPSREKTVSPAMKRAGEAAVEAWQTFVADLRNGKLIANARYPETGERHDLDPADWWDAGLRLDVREGTLFAAGRGGQPDELWWAITLRENAEAKKPEQPEQPAEQSEQSEQSEQQELPILHKLILDILLPAFPNGLREISTSILLRKVNEERWDEACKARGLFGNVRHGQPDYPVPSWDTIDRVKKLYDGRRPRR